VGLKWTQEDKHHFTAPGGYSVERRCGHWMTFVPGEDSAFYVSPHGGYFHREIDYSDLAKSIADKHAK